MEQVGGGLWGVIAPLVFVYALFVAMLLAYRRSGGRDRRAGGPPPPWAALVRHLAVTSGAGYLIFLAIVLAFAFAFPDAGEAVRDAIVGGGFLWLVGLVALSAMGWAEGRFRG